jgi:hypothetical protein
MTNIVNVESTAVDLNKFVTDNPFKTRAMTVTVYDANNQVLGEFNAPPGFRLEQLVLSLYHDTTIRMSCAQDIFTVAVIADDKVFRTYVGRYYGPKQYQIMTK